MHFSLYLDFKDIFNRQTDRSTKLGSCKNFTLGNWIISVICNQKTGKGVYNKNKNMF